MCVVVLSFHSKVSLRYGTHEVRTQRVRFAVSTLSLHDSYANAQRKKRVRDSVGGPSPAGWRVRTARRRPRLLGSKGFSCRCCSYCSTASRVATSSWTCSACCWGDRDRTGAAGEGVLGLARADSPRRHVAIRRGAGRPHHQHGCSYHWTSGHGETIAAWPCCGHVRGTDTAASCNLWH
jgi:hypothetical protein